MEAGRITGVFGLRGELKCEPTNAARNLFHKDARFLVQLQDGSSRDVRLRSVRPQRERLVVALEAVNSIEAAQPFTGATFLAPREKLELSACEYLDQDLCGCEVFDRSQKRLGTVERVEHYPASDMLVVNGKMIPFIGDFVRSVELEAKRIFVVLPPGLMD